MLKVSFYLILIFCQDAKQMKKVQAAEEVQIMINTVSHGAKASFTGKDSEENKKHN